MQGRGEETNNKSEKSPFCLFFIQPFAVVLPLQKHGLSSKSYQEFCDLTNLNEH